MIITELGLKKPEGTDRVDVTDINDNTDLLSRELTALARLTGGNDIFGIGDGTLTGAAKALSDGQRKMQMALDDLTFAENTAGWHHCRSYLENGTIHLSFGVHVSGPVQEWSAIARVPAAFRGAQSKALIMSKAAGNQTLPLYFNAETGDISCIGAPEPGDYLIFG